MTTSRRNVGDGPEGILEILGALSALKNYYGTLPAIRCAALRIAGSATDNDERGHVCRLAQFVRRALVYVCDPINSEFVQTPDVLLCLINRDGSAAGDCDDHVLLFAALAESLGIACDVAGVEAPGTAGAVNHVVALVHYSDGSAATVDLCAKGEFQPSYSNLTVIP